MAIDPDLGELPFADMPDPRRARRRAEVDEIDLLEADVSSDLLAPVFVDGIPTYPELSEAPLVSEDEVLGVSEPNRQQLLALLEQERLVSVERRTLHTRIDFIHGQGASDEATVDQLDYLVAKERLLSVRRRTLHHQINKLRGKPTQS